VKHSQTIFIDLYFPIYLAQTYNEILKLKLRKLNTDSRFIRSPVNTRLCPKRYVTLQYFYE